MEREKKRNEAKVNLDMSRYKLSYVSNYIQPWLDSSGTVKVAGPICIYKLFIFNFENSCY